MPYYLAIDIGASSGRHIVGWRERAVLRTEEVYRFPNGAAWSDGRLVWDTERLLREVEAGIDAALRRFGALQSLSIDTWGVDYMLLRGDEAIAPCFAYRDRRTESAADEVHALVPFPELYARTGCQFQRFNTIYQLYTDLRQGRLEGATDFLMLPEYLMYRLCGAKAKEYTNATTTGLVNARTGEFDLDIIRRLGLPERLFPALTRPGGAIGAYCGVPVTLCATHDTASAVEGIAMASATEAAEGVSTPDEGLFLSSGTWSLLGAKLPAPLTDAGSMAANFTNEGGVGYIRFLKNIMGLWILQCLQKQLGLSFPAMAEMARRVGAPAIFDVNDPRFTAPDDMRGEILSAMGRKTLRDEELLASVHHSLAHSYGETVRRLEALTGRRWDRLCIAGGGAKNVYLNELTARYTGKEVIALPIEATALGNLKIQMEARA